MQFHATRLITKKQVHQELIRSTGDILLLLDWDCFGLKHCSEERARFLTLEEGQQV